MAMSLEEMRLIEQKVLKAFGKDDLLNGRGHFA